MFFLLLLFSAAFSATAIVSLFKVRKLFPLAWILLFLSIFSGIRYTEAWFDVCLARSLLVGSGKLYRDDVRFINKIVDNIKSHPCYYACINKDGLDYVEEERNDRH